MIMLETCLCAWACGVCSVTVYFKSHVAVKPGGCAYTGGGAFWWRCAAKHMAVRDGVMKEPVRTQLSSVM